MSSLTNPLGEEEGGSCEGPHMEGTSPLGEKIQNVSETEVTEFSRKRWIVYSSYVSME